MISYCVNGMKCWYYENEDGYKFGVAYNHDMTIIKNVVWNKKGKAITIVSGLWGFDLNYDLVKSEAIESEAIDA